MQATLVVLTLGLVAFAAVAGDNEPAAKAPRFRITTRRMDDRVDVQQEKDGTVLTVHSPFGISQATVQRLEDGWPRNVVLRLHLKGLESLHASNGEVHLAGSVGIREGKARLRLWMDGKEDIPLDEENPYWIKVRVLGRDGKPAARLPLEDGFIEMTLPRAFFKTNPRSIRLQWIDFYR